MPANVYECMILLDSNKVAGDLQAVVKQLHGILERNQAEVLASRPWDKDRKLAYPINGHKKGFYYLMCFRTEGQNLASVERDFALNETIMRTMILHVDLKLVDSVLELARNETGMALQTVNEPPDDDLGGHDDRGPRRGGRRSEPAAAAPQE
jgi:small subunit ribosomal protein S6